MSITLPVQAIDVYRTGIFSMFNFFLLYQVGYITEDDVKLLAKPERAIVDRIIDQGPCSAALLNHKDVLSLYLQVSAATRSQRRPLPLSVGERCYSITKMASPFICR
jgi:hypothetical protein